MPPHAQEIPVTQTIHGVTISDNYRWLEDQNSPATRAWIAAEQKYTAEFFVSVPQREASKDKLAIFGTSNGGLLMGAAMTHRPNLFRVVVCGAPLLDMIRYQDFKIAKLWVPEYGSSDDPKQFTYLLKYSPYQHVETGMTYPAVLFWTGDNDTRVDPLHARKMTALMQEESAPGRPILIRYDT